MDEGGCRGEGWMGGLLWRPLKAAAETHRSGSQNPARSLRKTLICPQIMFLYQLKQKPKVFNNLTENVL